MISARAAARIVGIAVSLVATTASAQPRRVAPAPAGPQLSASTYGGYDRPLFTPSTSASLQPSGQGFSGADLNLTYSRSGRRIGMSSHLGLSNRYYPEFTPPTAPSYGGGLSVASNYQGRWQWNLGAFAHYAPFSAASLFATATMVNGQQLAVANAPAFQQSTVRQANVNATAGLSYALSRRTQVSLTGVAGRLVPIDSQVPEVEFYTAALRLSRSISRSLSAFVGYNLNQNRVGAQGATPASSIQLSAYDFGIDFSRPLQLTRNTTLSFHTGIVNVPGTGGKDYRFIGGVAIDRYFGRSTWVAQLAANRDTRFAQTFRNSVSATGVSLSASGRLVGRFGTIFASNFASGTINAAQSVGFESYSGSATLRFDVRRKVAVFAEYAAFLSDVDDTTLLTVGQPSGRFGRQSIRGGLSFGLSPFAP